MEIMDTKGTLLPYFWTQWTLYHPMNSFAIKWGARGRRFPFTGTDGKSSRPDFLNRRQQVGGFPLYDVVTKINPSRLVLKTQNVKNGLQYSGG